MTQPAENNIHLTKVQRRLIVEMATFYHLHQSIPNGDEVIREILDLIKYGNWLDGDET